MVELDLHGYTVKEAFEIFLNFYQSQLKIKTHFIVIHGYGSTGDGGKIKSKLHSFLSKNRDKVIFYPGENISKNPGVTLVEPKLPLPTTNDILSQKIIEFCSTPKTKEKIIGKFRIEGMNKVNNTIKNLEKNKSLKIIQKGKFKCYIQTNS